jgi:hypothetical protein
VSSTGLRRGNPALPVTGAPWAIITAPSGAHATTPAREAARGPIVAEHGLLTVAGLRHGVPAAVPARALPGDARGVTPEIPLAGHDGNNFYYKAGCAARKL